VEVLPKGAAIAFERREGGEHIVVVFNPDSTATTATLQINAKSFLDLLSAERFNKTLSVRLDGYTARWLLLKNEKKLSEKNQ
jgi:outer membrane protein OmpA-like peptidoglycan-associated protein